MINIDKLFDDLVLIQNKPNYIKNDYENVKTKIMQILNIFYRRLNELKPKFNTFDKNKKDLAIDIIDDTESIQDVIDNQNWVQNNMQNVISVLWDINVDLKKLEG